MKKAGVILLLISGSLHAQKMPDTGLGTVRINEPDKTVVAEVGQGDENPKIKPGLFYYWYSAGEIHATQGGFSGRLLNGRYAEFYLNKNLKQQGNFKTGLKTGIWKTWKEDGTADQVTRWEKGVIVPETSPSFWGKIKLFFKKLWPHKS